MAKDQVKLKIDGRRLSHEQSEYIRIQAVKAVRINGSSAEEVIKTFGLQEWMKKNKNFWYALIVIKIREHTIYMRLILIN